MNSLTASVVGQLLLVVVLCSYGAHCLPKIHMEGRIIGGSPIPITEAKHQVAVIIDMGPVLYLCGGVLVKPDVVLTSIKCFFNNDPTKVGVMAGTNDFLDIIDPSKYQFQNASKIVFHSSFQDPVHNNIALIKLQQNFTINDKVGAVPIYDSSFTEANCTTTGWGWPGDDDDENTILLSVKVNLYNKTRCEQELAAGNFNMERVICTKNAESYHGPCIGDFGGALMCNNRFVGISTFGICDGSNLPALYTEVRHFQQWVEDNSR